MNFTVECERIARELEHMTKCPADIDWLGFGNYRLSRNTAFQTVQYVCTVRLRNKREDWCVHFYSDNITLTQYSFSIRTDSFSLPPGALYGYADVEDIARRLFSLEKDPWRLILSARLHDDWMKCIKHFFAGFTNKDVFWDAFAALVRYNADFKGVRVSPSLLSVLAKSRRLRVGKKKLLETAERIEKNHRAAEALL